jgi:hypothetical protein
MSASNKKSSNQIQILQFNQMKGVRSGRKEEVKRGEDSLTLSSQQAVKLPGEYLVAVVENGKIVEWQPASMLDMRCTAIE